MAAGGRWCPVNYLNPSAWSGGSCRKIALSASCIALCPMLNADRGNMPAPVNLAVLLAGTAGMGAAEILSFPECRSPCLLNARRV